VDHYFILTKVENTGAFLSFGQSLPKPIRFILLLLLPVIVMVFTLIYIVKQKDLTKITLISLCFIIGGGISNLFDRILHGSVTDFMHMDFGFFRTGIFNLADVSIMIGLFLILIEAFIKSSKSKKITNEEPV
jgi:signal peptidase II